jgi:hypothetical protein
MGVPRIPGPGLRVPVIVLLSAVFAFAATNLISYAFFRHIPHVHDEMAYLFQAKIFSLGKLEVPSPAPREAFDFPHVINNGKWYSQYPPGFPLLLMIGVWLGIPWLANPLMSALTPIVLYLLGKELYGETEGRWAAVLGSLSIWFLLLSSTMLSHTAGMLFYALFLLFSFRALNSASRHYGALAGLALGMALLIRPFNAAAIAAPVLAYLGLRLLTGPRRRRSGLAGLAIALLAAVAVLLLFNQVTNGHPLRWGYTVKYGEAHGLGFGRSGYLGVPHTPERALSLLGENMAAINRYLFGWPVSSFLFLVPFLIPVKDERRKRTADLLLSSSFLTLALGLFFYWGTQVYLGARMYFEAFPILVLVTARGIAKTPVVLSRLAASLDVRAVEKALAGGVALMTIFAFGVTFPRWVRPAGTEDFDRVIAKDFCGVSSGIGRAIERAAGDRSLVVLKLLYAPKKYFPDSWWGSGFFRNDPELRNRIIYAQDGRASNQQLLRSFPDRKVYLYVGTLNKGMLMPIENGPEGVHYGRPHSISGTSDGCAELVESPLEMFRPYSDAFRAHLEDIFRVRPPDEIDVVRLAELSETDEAAGNTQAAIFDLEAALQIENDAAERRLLLDRLARLSLKAGDAPFARLIQARLADPAAPRVYNVSPERGY